MRKLASVSADIYHKHYADNAYAKAHEETRLEDTHIVTYAHYSQLQSAGYFLNRYFFNKSKSPKAIIGIGGLGIGLEKDKFEGQLAGLIRFLPKHVDLYVHAACHVKMLSYNSVTTIGSQNVSSTSMPYLSAEASPTYRHHEVQIEFQDNSLACARALFDEIICDPSLHFRLSRTSAAAEVVSHLLKGFSLEEHRRKIEFAQDLGALLDSNIQFPDNITLAQESIKNHDLISLVTRIYEAREVTRAHLDELFEIMYLDDDDYPLGEVFTDYVFELSRLLESVGEEFMPEKDSLLLILRSVYSRKMALAEGEEFCAFVDEVKEVIEKYSATDMGEFVARHQHHLTRQIMEDPDYEQRAISLARDEDGNLDENVVCDALLNDAVNPRRYLGTLNLSDFIAALHKVIEEYYIAAVAKAFERMRERRHALSDIYQRELRLEG